MYDKKKLNNFFSNLDFNSNELEKEIEKMKSLSNLEKVHIKKFFNNLDMKLAILYFYSLSWKLQEIILRIALKNQKENIELVRKKFEKTFKIKMLELTEKLEKFFKIKKLNCDLVLSDFYGDENFLSVTLRLVDGLGKRSESSIRMMYNKNKNIEILSKKEDTINSKDNFLSTRIDILNGKIWEKEEEIESIVLNVLEKNKKNEELKERIFQAERFLEFDLPEYIEFARKKKAEDNFKKMLKVGVRFKGLINDFLINPFENKKYIYEISEIQSEVIKCIILESKKELVLDKMLLETLFINEDLHFIKNK